jgi:NAD(P)-dependent dehydrogenase (short-subunit alcohol dehydrogenase family)
MDTADKVAIVTGAGRGIGKRIAERLAMEGVRVALADIDREAAEGLAEYLRKSFKVDTASKRTDVRKKSDLVDMALTRFGRIDVLVNSAGVMVPSAFSDITAEQWDDVMASNLRGVFLTCQSVMPIMKSQRQGAILNMDSITGKIGGLASGAHYAVSKAGVHCLTIVLAREMAPFAVRVNALAPGLVNTSLLRVLSDEVKTSLAAGYPLKRLANVEDVAEAALFLLSDKAKHITGEILDVNGGLLMD